jgi:hypothetical protein
MSATMAALYERDFVRWTEEQASALRAAAALGTNLPLDWENLAEEIDSLGRSLKHELRSRLMTIMEHLLKLQNSSVVDPRGSWIETISRERLIVEDLLEESPSLKSELGAVVEKVKPRAQRLAARSLSRFGEPARVPIPDYTEEQVLGDWIPGDPPLPAGGERG